MVDSPNAARSEEREEIPGSANDRVGREKDLAEALRGRTCFIVMPFGEKPVSVGSGAPGSDAHRFEMFDFDAVYSELIRPCLSSQKFEVVRADEEPGSGMIHQQMIQRLIDSDLVIVDVSSWNPNVFYELGIRHAAQKSGTLIVRRDAENLPFNIAGMRAIDYPSFRTKKEWEDNPDRAEEAHDRLRAAVIASLRPGLPDSPVHTLVSGLNISRPKQALSYRYGVACALDGFIDRKLGGDAQSIKNGEPLRSLEDLKQAAATRRVGVIEGDLSLIDCVDAWVNPENTRFEMARPHDHSISAIIRSRSESRGDLSRGLSSWLWPDRWRDDELARRLKREARRAGGEVETGAAVALPPFQLRQRNKLAAIVHIAVQTGMRGRGYQTTRNLEDCVQNALDAVGAWNSSPWRRVRGRRPIRSILFPLFGAGNPDWETDWVAERLIGAASQYLALAPQCLLQRVYFLAYTDQDRSACRSAFIRLGLADEERLNATYPAASDPPADLSN